MSHNKTPITKILELLKLKFEDGLSQRKIAKKINIATATVSVILRQFQQSQLIWPLPSSMTDNQLEARLYPNRVTSKSKVIPQFAAIHQQLKVQGMTKQKLWQKYSEQHQSQAYGFTQFCERYKNWLSKQKTSVRQSYKGGDKLFVSYVSSGVPIVNPETGELREVTIFIATLAASNYTYIEAFESDDIESAFMANVNMLSFFGGVPKVITTYQEANFSKNTASFKNNYRSFAQHYDIKYTLVRLRASQRKSKLVYNLHIITRWLLMMLRSTEFYTLTSLQNTLYSLSTVLNQKLIKPQDETRGTQFKSLDFPSLTPLPNTSYEFFDHKEIKARFNFHVKYKGHYYSVPAQYSGTNLTIRATASSVYIYNDDEYCIAQHPRRHKQGGYSTTAWHMPTDKELYQWSPQSILRWARKIGSATATVVDAILHSTPHPEHSYQRCCDILRLTKDYSGELLELVCKDIRSIKGINQTVIEQAIKRLR